MSLNVLALFFLGTVAAGGIVWVFLYPLLSGERHAERRQAMVARPEPAGRAAAGGRAQVKVRRDQIEETLKQLEIRQRNVKNPPLALRIQRAGLSLTNRQFTLISVALGLGAFALGFTLKIG